MKKQRDTPVGERHIGVILESLDDKISTVAEQYGDIKKALDSNTEMTASIKEDAEIIKMDIEFIKSGFKKKVDVDEFAALERRVAVLERHNR